MNANPTNRIVTSIVPSLLFLAVNAVAGVVAAVAVGTLASAGLIVARRRRSEAVGLFLPLALVYVIVRGVAGMVTQSEDVFFAFGLAASGLVALGVLASAFTASPAASFVMPIFVRYSPATVEHPQYRRVGAQVTAAWAVCELALTVWEAMHLTSLSAAEFVGLRTFMAWPVMGVLIGVLIFYVRLRLDPIERHSGRMHAVSEVPAMSEGPAVSEGSAVSEVPAVP